jgi:hypothetical protein
MKIKLRRFGLGAGALVVAGGLTLATAGVALAADPTFEPDTLSTGTVTLTDSTGAVVTSGNVNGQPIAAYAVGTSFGHASGDTKATLYLCTPQQTAGGPGSWPCDKVSQSTNISPEPSFLPAGEPFVTGAAGDHSVATAISNAGANTTSGDPGIYQLRVVTSGPGQAAVVNNAYNSVDIKITGTGASDTWSVVYPDQTDATTTVVTANPSSPNTSSTPSVVTFTASVTPAHSVTTSGGVGSVQFFNSGTLIGTTQLISGAGPYTAAVQVTEPSPSDSSITAMFVPYNGNTLEPSTSAPLPYYVGAPSTVTSTSLTVNQDGFAGDTNSYDSVVTLPAGATCAGSVSFFDNTTTLVAGPITVGPGTPCEAHATNTFATAAAHSITAVFTPPAGSTSLTGSTSSAVVFSQTVKPVDCASAGATGSGSCTDTQNIQGTIPAGTLVISTPYNTNHPLDLGTLALDPSGTYFTGHATFGDGTQPGGIFITDTRAGDLPWTAQAQASVLSDGGSNAGSTINGENVGLSGLAEVPVSGNGFNGTATNFTTFNNFAATPPVSPTDTGTQGLGNTAHDIAQAKQGFGSIGLVGSLTLNAPSSTEAGLFKGTITFTIVGSLV